MARRRRERVVTTDDLGIDALLALSHGAHDLDLVRLFGSVAAAQEVWRALRDEFMPHPDHLRPWPGGGDYHAPPGQRPWSWWAWEAGEEMPATPAAQRSRLKALGVLAPWEWAASEEFLRREVLTRFRLFGGTREETVRFVAQETGLTVAQVRQWQEEADDDGDR